MKLFTAVLFVLTLTCIVDAGPSGGPNVVMLISDDQAWGDYGFMGHPHIKTPALDKLAAESLTFTRGYVPDSLCRPSLATMITGLYPHQHGIVGNDPPVPESLRDQKRKPYRHPEYVAVRERYIDHIDTVPTLPKMLRALGYVSHQSGKWWEGHFSRGGFTHGMTHGDRATGGRHGDDGLVIGRKGMKPVFDFIDDAVERETPFMVWYAPLMPHSPHTPPQRLLDKYQKLTDSIHVARYWAMCEWFDETCGQLLDYLDKKNLADNTIVVYVCDNGWIQSKDNPHYAERSKRSQYDGGIRTPIMVRWPGHIKPRMDTTRLASSIDLAPTILAACGAEPTADMHGINLADDEAVSKREAIFGAIYDHDIVSMDDPAASLRYWWCIEGEYKLILPNVNRFADEKAELFHITADPYEQHLPDSEQMQHLPQMLERILQWQKTQ
jgi:uncharacterized sulfatase